MVVVYRGGFLATPAWLPGEVHRHAFSPQAQRLNPRSNAFTLRICCKKAHPVPQQRSNELPGQGRLVGGRLEALVKHFWETRARHPSARDLKNFAVTHDSSLSERDGKILDTMPFSIILNESKALVLFNVLAFGYALTAILVKVMDEGDGLISSYSALPLTSLEFTFRFGFATLFFLWPSINRQKARMLQMCSEEDIEEEKGDVTSLLLSGIELGIWMFCTYAGQAIGLETSSANHATLLLTLSVVLVPFMESFFGRKIGLRLWISAIMVCCGVVMLETGGLPSLGSSIPLDCLMKGIPSGHVWCLLGALGSAIHVVRAEMLASKFDTMALLTVQMLTTTTLSLIWFSMDLSHCMSSCSDVAQALVCLPWPMIFLAGPVGTGMCEWLELEGLRFVSASKATLILMASPLWTSILAYFWLGETLDASSALGGSLILLASVQTQLLASHDEK